MIYVARTEFGMSARELFTTPEWELDVLFREREREIKEAKRRDR